MRVTRIVFVLFAVVLVAAPAVAQERGRAEGQARKFDYDFEIFGGLGWARRGGDEGSRGGGPLLAGGFGFRPLGRLGFEVEAGVLKHSRGFGGPVKVEGTVVLVSANVLYHFSESRAQWYVLGGLGWMRSEQTVRFVEARHFTETFAVWSVGVGVKVFLTPRLLLRPEVRYSGAEALGVLGLPRVSVGLGYVW